MIALSQALFALIFSLQLTQNQTYEDVRADFASWKQELQAANSLPEHKLQAVADSLCKKLVDDLIPYWYGTPWDFNGTSDEPGKGLIACGYFVSTTMNHSGFKLNRYRMAQQAASPVMKKLCKAEDIHTYRGISTTALSQKLTKLGYGLYMVGLDNHVGYLWNDGVNCWFIHASYGNPAEVVKEKVSDSEVLSWSGLFMVGKLNTTFIAKNWINNTEFVFGRN